MSGLLRKMCIGLCAGFITLSGSGVQAYVHNPLILAEIEERPANYYYGHGLGSGAFTFVDKTSVNVEVYEPPEYIITYDSIDCRYPIPNKKKLTSMKRVRLYFNYDKQEAYVEKMNRAGENEWKFITPSAPHSMNYEADMVFGMAYNMHFYKNAKYQSGYLEGKVKDAQDFVDLPFDNSNVGDSFK